MTTLQAVIEKILALPDEKQRQVLAYLEQIGAEPDKRKRKPLFNPEGLLEDIPSNLTLKDFQQTRREMWGTSSDRELP